jgi:hypothetical protein
MQENPISICIVHSSLMFFTASTIVVFIFVPKLLRMSNTLNKKNTSKVFQANSEMEASNMLFGTKFQIMEACTPQLNVI